MKNAIEMHEEWKGKIEIKSKVDVTKLSNLSLAYTPGVADVCLKIKDDKSLSYTLTGRWNRVAIVTDGTAILGLGNIGPEAGMPVMEGKACLFKAFGDVDAYPLCINTTDTEEIIKFIKYIEPSFGGINLEDISAPRCFEIERRLKEELSIPVFHDDQHGTAIVVGGALLNALKVTGRKIEDINAVISGAGAAGTAIAKYLLVMGIKNVIMVDKFGIICEGDANLNSAHQELSKITNKNHIKGNLRDAFKGADLFVGVSVGKIVDEEMIKSMAKDPIVFSLANPVPEISYKDAIEAGAKVVGTGSSEWPNQINNVLVFPGIFRGALDARAKDINLDMMLKASYAIASSIDEKELRVDYILPYATDINAHKKVSNEVYKEALKQKQ